jgi:arsenate reductase (glutaredoxin)
MITIYHNPRCSKSRFALEQIKNYTSEFTVIEYLNKPFTEQSLEALLEKLGLKPIDIVRVKESDFKEKFAGRIYTDQEWIKILIENPKLIQRPIVENNSRACIAREIDSLNQILGNK